jgi:hypothetical protein
MSSLPFLRPDPGGDRLRTWWGCEANATWRGMVPQGRVLVE